MPGVISRPKRPARGKLGRPAKQSTASITSFARVSKLQTTTEKEALQKVAAIERPKTTIEIVLPSIRKRKAAEDADLASADAVAHPSTTKKLRRDADPAAASTPASKLGRRKTVTFALPEDAPATPSSALATSSKRKRSSDAAQAVEAASTETERPEALLERLNLQSSPTRKRTKTSVLKSKFEAEFDLPQDLLDLLDLHVSFLRTLALHYVHNNSSVPVDMAEVCPRTTQVWGKRKVTVDDIRRLVGILGWTQEGGAKSSAPYFMFELGRGRICLELHNPAAGPLCEQKLNMEFEANLRALWAARRDTNMKAFVASLPMTPIKACPKPSPLLSKGQRALAELKNGIARKKEEQAAKAEAIPTVNADGTKMSLLDRIRYKELLQAQAAQGPTREELQRRAALQRAGDVAAVIGMLTKSTSTGQARVSFTMAVILGKLKDSARVPVAPEEAAECVRLLASEVAPQWLRIVTIGGREHVVVQTAFQPSKAAVEAQVNALSG